MGDIEAQSPQKPASTNTPADEAQVEQIESSDSQQKPTMGSNIGSDASSDVETQEPVKNPAQADLEVIEESDVEEVSQEKSAKSNAKNVEGKMRQIIEKIDADSEDDDPLPADATVDFGDDEELEDVEEPKKEVKSVTSPKKKKEEASGAHDDEKEEGTVESKEDDSKTAPKKKAKTKKDKEPGPTKTIKKNTEAKAKTKASKPKATTAAKKKDRSPSPKATTKKVLPPKKDKAVSEGASPKPEKKDSTKAVSKPTSKSEGKSRGKANKTGAKQAENEKSEKVLKPKKVIGKEAKSTKKVVAKKDEKTTPVKTFSKKEKTGTGKSVAKGKKNAAVKKEKTDTKPKKGAKKGRPKAPKSSEEEDDEDVEMVVHSDDEPASVSSDSEMEEEVARTPASKLPILGNLACSSRDDNCTALLDHAVEQLGKYSVVSYGADSECSLAAYIIGKDTKRGWGLLQARILGVPLVSDEWLSSSISEGKWKPMDVFRSDRFGQSPRSVEENATSNGRILDGLRVKVVCTGKDAPSVRKALRLCGARIAETRVDIIINDTEKEVSGAQNVVKKWLADSIESAMALDYGPYLLGKQ